MPGDNEYTIITKRHLVQKKALQHKFPHLHCYNFAFEGVSCAVIHRNFENRIQFDRSVMV